MIMSHCKVIRTKTRQCGGMYVIQLTHLHTNVGRYPNDAGVIYSSNLMIRSVRAMSPSRRERAVLLLYKQPTC